MNVTSNTNINVGKRAWPVMVASVLMLGFLAGCGATDTNAGKTNAENQNAGSETTQTESAADKAVKRFVACLVEKGFEAKALEAGGIKESDLVAAIRPLDTDGEFIEPDSKDGNSVRWGIRSGELYPNEIGGISISSAITGESAEYLYFKDHTGLAGTPMASMEDDYAACEQRFPDYSQTPSMGLPSQRDASEEDKRAVLDFAKQARDKGFTWVADPSGDQPLSIVIPTTASREDVKRFLLECPSEGTPVVISWQGDYPYDTGALMDEVANARQQ